MSWKVVYVNLKQNQREGSLAVADGILLQL